MNVPVYEGSPEEYIDRQVFNYFKLNFNMQFSSLYEEEDGSE